MLGRLTYSRCFPFIIRWLVLLKLVAVLSRSRRTSTWIPHCGNGESPVWLSSVTLQCDSSVCADRSRFGYYPSSSHYYPRLYYAGSLSLNIPASVIRNCWPPISNATGAFCSNKRSAIASWTNFLKQANQLRLCANDCEAIHYKFLCSSPDTNK